LCVSLVLSRRARLVKAASASHIEEVMGDFMDGEDAASLLDRVGTLQAAYPVPDFPISTSPCIESQVSPHPAHAALLTALP
jgi:hypothetical protein